MCAHAHTLRGMWEKKNQRKRESSPAIAPDVSTPIGVGGRPPGGEAAEHTGENFNGPFNGNPHHTSPSLQGGEGWK